MSNDGLAAQVRRNDERISAIEDVLASHLPGESGGDVWRRQQEAKVAAKAAKNAEGVAIAQAAQAKADEAGAKADAERAEQDKKAAEKAAKAREVAAKESEKVIKSAQEAAAKAQAEADRASAIARVTEGNAESASAAAAAASGNIKKAKKSGKVHIGLLAGLVLLSGIAIGVARDIVSWTDGDNINAGTAEITTDDAGTATLVVDGATITDATISDDLTVTDDAQIGGLLRVTKTAQTATNNQAITIADGVLELDGIGSADNITNTVTLAELGSTAVGGYCLLIVETASSNLITIADSGFPKLAGAWVADNNDSLLLYIADTNNFVEVSRSDN